MSVQPSASKTALLLECQKPFDPDWNYEKIEAGEGARYGTAFHALMEIAPLEKGTTWDPGVFERAVDENCEKQFLAAGLRQELAEQLRGSLLTLQKWLAGKNQFSRKFNVKRLKREVSHAFGFPAKNHVTVRRITNPTEKDHRYEDLEDGEVAGTSDIESDELVLDHKTGQDEGFALPAKHAQLRTLSLATREPPVVAIFHADRRGLPVVYADEMRDVIRQKHTTRLWRAMRRIGDGRLKPGPWCGYCPARGACPVKTADVLQGAAALATDGTLLLARMPRTALMAKGTVGRMHQFFAEFERLKEAAKPRMKAYVKELAEAGEEEERRPDGKILRIEMRTEERLSKTKIVAALGVKEAERLFAKLRKAGALEETESEGVWARFPD